MRYQLRVLTVNLEIVTLKDIVWIVRCKVTLWGGHIKIIIMNSQF